MIYQGNDQSPELYKLWCIPSTCRTRVTFTVFSTTSTCSHSAFLPCQIPTLPRSYRERERERERLRRESETEEEEERERVLGEVSDGEESDDTAYDRRHGIPPGDLPWLDFANKKKNLPPSISFRFTTAFPHVSAQLRLPAEAHSAFLAGCIARCVLSSLLQQNCWIPDRLAYFELNKHRCWNVDAAKNQAWDFCFLQERELQQRVVPLVYSCHFLFIPPSLSWFVI